MTLSDEAFSELRAEFNAALPSLIAGKPDRTDLMCSIERASKRLPRVREIIRAVSYASNVEFMAIVGGSKKAKTCKARVLAMCLAFELRPDMTRAQIAGTVGRERTVLQNALVRAEDMKMNDNDFVHWYANARRRLGYA